MKKNFKVSEKFSKVYMEPKQFLEKNLQMTSLKMKKGIR